MTKKNIIAVVKSDAYSLGANKVIPFLMKEGVTFFAFNELKEYQKVAHLCLGMKILVMSSVDNYLNANITYTINSLSDAVKLLKSPLKHKTFVHLQVDTGMNRYGIRCLKEAKKIINRLKTHPLVEIEGIYTHFSSSSAEFDYYNKQVELFHEYTRLYFFKVIHANATASLHKLVIGNYVRIGLALYGYHETLKLKPAINVLVTLTNTFKITNQKGISYEQKYNAEKNALIGTLSIGYNESFDFKNVYYHNLIIPVIGLMGMNHTNILLPCKIKSYTCLNIFPKNDKIYRQLIKAKQISFHRALTSFKALPKIYMEYQTNYDFSPTNQNLSKTCFNKKT